ncbi:MAG: hypothetical protein HQL12_09425 [Candidatus Omnitrophica bacterium]|nr:hypothetical protein [Candidatus Omnitrophota bacterium]
MIKKITLAIAVVASILAMPLLSGCIALLAGGAIGFEVSADSVKAQFYNSYERVYRVSLDVANDMVGSVSMADEATGWIKADSQA